MKKRTIIVDAVRSPMGMKNGKMIGIRPDDLGAKTLKVLLERNSSISPESCPNPMLPPFQNNCELLPGSVFPLILV